MEEKHSFYFALTFGYEKSALLPYPTQAYHSP